MYQLINGDPATQWIEIYNTSSYTLSLSGIKIGDEETQGGGEGMAAFPEGAVIGPQQALVIAKSAAGFEFVFGWLPDYEFTPSDETVPDLVPYSTWASGVFNLAGQGDEVLILNGEDQLVDAMSYGLSSYAFNPPAPTVPYGHSLERYPADVDTDTAQDWIDQAAPAPGSVRLAPRLR
jgi:glycerophosphoryl diester phosphodiesterase